MLSPRHAGRSRLSPPASMLVVFALGAGATALAAGALWRSAAAEDGARFAALVGEAEGDVRDRLQAYVVALRGAAGLFAARDGDVGRAAFAAYARRLELPEHFPGIQGVGFARRVPAAEVGRLEGDLRRQGDAGFRVWPAEAGARERFPITYLEPPGGRNRAAFGFDMFGEPARRAAMERARDTGLPAATGKVTLVQETGDDAQAGFLLYVPVYRGGDPPDSEAARRERLLGFVYSPFRADDLFAGIFGAGRGALLDAEVYDGTEVTPDALLHRPASGRPGAAGFTHRATVDVPGRTWTVVFGARPEFGRASGGRLVSVVVLGGLLVTLTLARFAGVQARARVAAADAARRAEGILESITDGFFAVDPDWRFAHVNREAERLLGRGRADLRGRHLWEEFPDLLATDFGRNLRRAMAAGGTVAFEAFYAPHGHWYDARAYGSPEGVSVYFRDATERRKAEEALRRSEAFYRTLGDAVPDFLWTGGTGVGLEFANQRWRDYCGLSVDELNARGWQEVVHPDDREALARQFAAAARAGTPFEAEARLRRHDGAYRWFLARSVPAPAEGGGVRWVGTLTDIDDRKRAEDALREEAARKDEFLAMLAHELRNPLAPLRNALHVLRSGPDAGPGLGELLALMERQVEHLVRLVDDLLDVSRLLRGKIGLRSGPVDLAEVVRRAAETAQPLLDAHGHRLEADLPAGPLPLHGDPVRLAQVFANLLNNAAKFTERPGVIRLGARREGGAWVVRVSDPGSGIAPDLLSRIFDVFVQGDRSAARSQGGLGLGLTLVRRLAELHGGGVAAESPGPGRGSTFTVRLPAETPAEPPPAAAPAPRKPAPRRVLVVDDNADAAETLALVLRTLGHEVRTAHDGAAALAAAAEFGPAAVVLDIGMPGMDGYEVARRLRAAGRQGTARPTLIALTGYGQEEDRRRAREAGFDRHLVKPVEPAELEAVLATPEPGAGTGPGQEAANG